MVLFSLVNRQTWMQCIPEAHHGIRAMAEQTALAPLAGGSGKQHCQKQFSRALLPHASGQKSDCCSITLIWLLIIDDEHRCTPELRNQIQVTAGKPVINITLSHHM